METSKQIIPGFKAVTFMREVRDEISKEIKDLNFEELKKYFEDRREKFTAKEKSTTGNRL